MAVTRNRPETGAMQVSRSLRTLQECAFDQAVAAVKVSSRFRDWKSFRTHLVEELPYNSRGSREKFTQLIRAATFPDGNIRTLAETVWQAYGDEKLLQQIVRVSYLDNVPLIGRFVEHVASTLPKGAELAR